MTLHQKLSLDDYHQFLKETLYQNVIFKMIYGTGFILLALVIYNFVSNDFVYKSSFNGLLFITLLVLFFRRITHFSDKRRFNRNDYLDSLLEAHHIDFDAERISITKGKDTYKINMAHPVVVSEFPNFLVLTLTAQNKFPIKITDENRNDVDQLKEMIKTHNSKFEAA